MAAYAMAYEEVYGEPIDMAFILHIDYENQIVKEEKHMHKKDIPLEFQTFLHTFEVFKAKNARHFQ